MSLIPPLPGREGALQSTLVAVSIVLAVSSGPRVWRSFLILAESDLLLLLAARHAEINPPWFEWFRNTQWNQGTKQ